MKPGLVLGAALAGLVSASAATTRSAPAADPPAQSLFFMNAAAWRSSSLDEKVSLAADFMRVFCVRPSMSPVRLADCLDREARGDRLFDDALACVKTLDE